MDCTFYPYASIQTATMQLVSGAIPGTTLAASPLPSNTAQIAPCGSGSHAVDFTYSGQGGSSAGRRVRWETKWVDALGEVAMMRTPWLCVMSVVEKQQIGVQRYHSGRVVTGGEHGLSTQRYFVRHKPRGTYSTVHSVAGPAVFD